MKVELDKIKALREPRRFDETSDSSLQVVGDEEEDELQVENDEEPESTPPTSSSTSLKQG